MYAKFISDTVSWKRTGLAEVGEKGTHTWSVGPEDLHDLWDRVMELHIDLAENTLPREGVTLHTYRWRSVNSDFYLAPDQLLLSC